MASKLPARRTAELEPVGLMLPEDLTVDEWRKEGERLALAHHTSQWALGDWWNYGERKYGEGVEIAAVLGFEASTLRAYARVARQVESAIRNRALTWSHHAAVAALAPAAQKHMLDQALVNKWSVVDLKTAVDEASKPPPDKDTKTKKTGGAGGSRRAPKTDEPTKQRTPDEVARLTQAVVALPKLMKLSPEDIVDMENWDKTARSNVVRQIRDWAARFYNHAKGFDVTSLSLDPKDCRHPVGRRNGDQCQVCGGTVKGKAS